MEIFTIDTFRKRISNSIISSLDVKKFLNVKQYDDLKKEWKNWFSKITDMTCSLVSNIIKENEPYQVEFIKNIAIKQVNQELCKWEIIINETQNKFLSQQKATMDNMLKEMKKDLEEAKDEYRHLYEIPIKNNRDMEILKKSTEKISYKNSNPKLNNKKSDIQTEMKNIQNKLSEMTIDITEVSSLKERYDQILLIQDNIEKKGDLNTKDILELNSNFNKINEMLNNNTLKLDGLEPKILSVLKSSIEQIQKDYEDKIKDCRNEILECLKKKYENEISEISILLKEKQQKAHEILYEKINNLENSTDLILSSNKDEIITQINFLNEKMSKNENDFILFYNDIKNMKFEELKDKIELIQSNLEKIEDKNKIEIVKILIDDKVKQEIEKYKKENLIIFDEQLKEITMNIKIIQEDTNKLKTSEEMKISSSEILNSMIVALERNTDLDVFNDFVSKIEERLNKKIKEEHDVKINELTKNFENSLNEINKWKVSFEEQQFENWRKKYIEFEEKQNISIKSWKEEVIQLWKQSEDKLEVYISDAKSKIEYLERNVNILEEVYYDLRDNLEKHGIKQREIEQKLEKFENTSVRFENDNIYIGNVVSSEKDNFITKIANIYGNNPAIVDSPLMLFCDNKGQLGTNTSSIVYKENIDNIGSVSNVIHHLRPVSFTYKTDENKNIQYGLIGEEVENVFPELVCYDKQDKIIGVSYHKLIPLLLNEIKVIKKDLDNLKIRS